MQVIYECESHHNITSHPELKATIGPLLRIYNIIMDVHSIKTSKTMLDIRYICNFNNSIQDQCYSYHSIVISCPMLYSI